jgi:hypothetical protein
MIKYALRCAFEHPFEGWFSTSADYDDQHARGIIECPLCGSSDIAKQIMAPAVTGTKAQRRVASPEAPTAEAQQMMMAAMGEVRRHVEENFDYVGDAFAREARDIHEGKSELRGIYGEASPKEVKSLLEDGVSVAPLPPKPPERQKLN